MTRGRSLKGLSGALALGVAIAKVSFAHGETRADDVRLEISRIRLEENRAFAETRQGARPELTLDPALTRAALRLLEQAHPLEGAAVVIDLKTSSVRVFAEVQRGVARKSVITEARMPAASVFKLVTTAALFESGGVRPNDKICIAGGIRSVERRHLDAPHGGEGVSCAPFSQALGFSRNAVYAQLATRRLARQDLIDVAERLGFNSNVPFDFPVPLGSLQVPYNDLEFARTATGFQGSTLSPLGAAYLASIIAQGGVAQRLHLLAGTSDSSGDDGTPTRVLKRATARRITKMMEVTVRSGTSRQVFNDESGHSLLPGVRVAGKTGTLRPGSRSETTSWFVGFAPADKPEIAVSVMLENGSVWRQRAAEVARDLLRVYFHRKGLPKIIDPLAPPEPASE
ncbi:MAG: penicillin-binding transpeptidase domain-containing protein [Myxococcota bacterium]